jgi:hypothetical protein
LNSAVDAGTGGVGVRPFAVGGELDFVVATGSRAAGQTSPLKEAEVELLDLRFELPTTLTVAFSHNPKMQKTAP